MEFSHQIHIEHPEGTPGMIEIDPPYAEGVNNTVRASMYINTSFGNGYVRMTSEEVSALIDALTAVKVKIDEKTTIRRLRGF